MDNLRKNRGPSNSGTRESAASDAELVEAARQGDKRAFVEIVARYQAMVCGIALGILGDLAASEDAGQEAFLIAWRKFNHLEDPSRLRPWLAAIVRNAALGHLRRRREHANLEDIPELPDESPGPDQIAAAEDEAEIVRRTLATLPETYRIPLVLYYRENQSVRVVAESLEITEDAVKQRLARGRELLRNRISSVIETTLARTGPTSVFTIAVASAIGALAAPSTVAAGAFGTAASTTVNSTTTSLLTAMSASKVFLGTTAAVAIVCVPIGYHLDTAAPSEPARETAPVIESASEREAPPAFEGSGLVAEWRALLEKFGTTSESMPVLHQAIAELEDPFRRRAFHTALVAEWVQVDPASGLNFFLADQADARQRRHFFEEWFKENAQLAVDSLMSSGPGWEKLAREFLPEIARQIPWRVAEISSRLPEEPNSFWDNRVKDAFTIMAENDLTSVLREAERVTGPNRDYALAGIAQVWAKNDFEAAIDWARGLPEGTDRDEIIRAALVGKAAVDPIGALERADLVPAGGRHAYFGSTTGARVLSEAAKTNFETTIDWLGKNPERFRQADLLEGLAQPVTERLLSDTSGFLTEHHVKGSLGILVPAISSAMLNQASGQQEEIWDWLQFQWASEPVQELKTEVLTRVGFKDPLLAMRMIGDLPADPGNDHMVETVANSVLNGGRRLPQFESLYEQAPENLRGPLVERAFKFLGPSVLDDPQQWISRLDLLPEDSLQNGIEALANTWSRRNPEEALAWAASLSAGETRNGVLASITGNWARMDPYHAAEWVASLPPGTERDRSAGSFVDATADRFPREAWTWALSIQDSEERSRAAAQVVNLMGSRDPQTARAWIEQGPFSQETRESLHHNLEQNIQSSTAP
jgi:RNA polymerase sigma factor (sigma-70 family)